jgi:dihydrofolate reductase
MRRVRYHVAMSLDGYIAGPNGEFDWIPPDSDVDFAALFAEFDTLLMGRKTFDLVRTQDQSMLGDLKVYVFSRTLKPSDYPTVTIVSDRAEEIVQQLRREPGKDIWIFGGGELFRALAQAGLVDTVEPAVVPVILGGGIPSFPSPGPRMTLEFRSQRVYEKSGIVHMKFEVKR